MKKQSKVARVAKLPVLVVTKVLFGVVVLIGGIVEATVCRTVDVACVASPANW